MVERNAGEGDVILANHSLLLELLRPIEPETKSVILQFICVSTTKPTSAIMYRPSPSTVLHSGPSETEDRFLSALRVCELGESAPWIHAFFDAHLITIPLAILKQNPMGSRSVARVQSKAKSWLWGYKDGAFLL